MERELCRPTEIKCRSILNRSRLPGVEFVVNPYMGCGHYCEYCYTLSMIFNVSKVPEKDYRCVCVKVNAPEVLERQIRGFRGKKEVFMSSTCDPYQPLEKKYEITRKLLKILLRHGFRVSILTKYGLVLRDMGILKKFRDCEVGVTLTGLMDEDRMRLEPMSAGHSERIETLRALKDSGIKTYAFIGPIMPMLSKLETVFSDVSGLVDYAYVDRLNIYSKVWSNMEPLLKEHYPELLGKYRLLRVKNTSFARNYWSRRREKVKELSEKYSVPVRILF